MPTPRIRWEPCGEFECARVPLPLRYDRPTAEKVEIALIRKQARVRKVASIFLNPGGPGGSGIDVVKTFVSNPALAYPDEILDNFDLIGMDPRGTNASTNVRCFSSNQRRLDAGAEILTSFPADPSQHRAFVAAAEAQARACSTTGTPWAQAMTTANVARDLNVLSRAVDGNLGLTYIGISYGTYLGQVYANLFPDRFRALLLDAVVDPVAWALDPVNGPVSREERSTPLPLRVKTADALWRVLTAGFERCEQSGQCPLTDPLADYYTVAERLRTDPVTVDGSRIDLAYFITTTEQMLMVSEGPWAVADMTAKLLVATEPDATATQQRQAAAASEALAKSVEKRSGHRRQPAPDYPNERDAWYSVLCADPASNPRSVAAVLAAGRKADEATPIFGTYFANEALACASDVWTRPTNNPYRGPFNKVTKNPILILGNYYDRATHFDNAVKAHGLLRNSMLVRTDAWGHGIFGSHTQAGSCVNDTGVDYLLDPKGTWVTGVKTCLGFPQPFGTAGTNPFE